MTADNPELQWTPVRMAMVGGGPGAFIGPVHRRAAALDNLITLAAGSFSSDPARNRQAGRALNLPTARIYDSFTLLVERERLLPAEERIEFVAIVTPNHLHAPVALAALDHGFPVLCEKPLARSLAEACAMRDAVDRSGLPFAVTYTYLGYPLVHEARALIEAGRIGAVRRIAVSYTQGWLSEPVEASGNTQAAWRTDAAAAGAAGALGDIGVHAQNLLEFVSGERIAAVSADIRAAVPGRALDDDAAVLLRFGNGARGTLIASQICAGDENRLQLSVYGETGSLHWAQETPNELRLRLLSASEQRITANPALLTDARARAMLRLPGGHPEGYIEAFANIYRAFAQRLRGTDGGDLPSAADGVRSMAFVDAVIASSRADGRWQAIIEPNHKDD